MLLDISAGAIFAVVIPPWLRSRVSGAYTFVNYGIRVVGSLAGGILGSAIGPRQPLIGTAYKGSSVVPAALAGRPHAAAPGPARPVAWVRWAPTATTRRSASSFRRRRRRVRAGAPCISREAVEWLTGPHRSTSSTSAL